MSTPTVEQDVTVDVDVDLRVPCEWVDDGGRCTEDAVWLGTLACHPHHRVPSCDWHREQCSVLQEWDDGTLLICRTHGDRPCLPIRHWVRL